METRANHLLVGGFVLAFAAALIAFIVWIAGSEGDGGVDRYKIVFEGSVNGLSEGGTVSYSGVKIGEVRSIALDPQEPGKVDVVIEVQEGAPIKTDTEASLELLGITGARYVLLSGGSRAAEPLSPPPGEEMAEIPSKPSTLAQVLEGAPEIMENINILLSRGNALLNEDNLRLFNEILTDVATVSGTLASREDQIANVIDRSSETLDNLNEVTTEVLDLARELRQSSGELTEKLSGTLDSVNELAGSVEGSLSTVQNDVAQMIGSFQGAAEGIESMAGQVEGLVAENREPLRDFTASGLYELANLLTEARQLITNLNRVTIEVERDPARFLFGDPQEGYETDDGR